VKVKQKGRANTHLVDSEPENRSHQHQSGGSRGVFIRDVRWHRGMGSIFAHHDTVSNSVMCSLVCSKVGPSLLLLDHGLKVGHLRAYSSPTTFLFAVNHSDNSLPLLSP